MDASGAVQSLVWRDGEVIEHDFEFSQLSDRLEDDSCVVWVDLCQPDGTLLGQLAEELSLDPNAVEDAVEQYERPKITRYASHKFLTAYSASLDAGDPEVRLSQISAFVLNNALITVRIRRDDREFDLAPVLRRWKETGDLISHGVGALVHGLLDVIVDSHFDAVQRLDDEIEDLEADLFDEKPQSKQVQHHSFALRKSLVQLRRVVLPMREVVGSMQRHDTEEHRSHDPGHPPRSNALHDPELDSYFQDLYDHVLRASEWTESLRDLISTIFETNLSLADARLNTIMKKLTSWAAIIAVPTAVTGFYGQNVPYPGFNHQWGFLVSTAIMVVLVVVLYVSFRRRDWL